VLDGPETADGDVATRNVPGNRRIWFSGLYVVACKDGPEDKNTLTWWPVMLLCAYVCESNGSLDEHTGTLTYTILGEMFAANVKTKVARLFIMFVAGASFGHDVNLPHDHLRHDHPLQLLLNVFRVQLRHGRGHMSPYISWSIPNEKPFCRCSRRLRQFCITPHHSSSACLAFQHSNVFYYSLFKSRFNN